MTATTVEVDLRPDQPHNPWARRLAIYGRPILAAAVVAAGVGLATLGGYWPLIGGVLAAATTAFFAWPTGPEHHHVSETLTGARLMVDQIVPVWRRQIDAARSAVEAGFTDMVQTFADLSTGLTEVVVNAEKLTPTAGAGAADEVLESCPHSIESMLEPMRRVVAQRDHVAAELLRGAEGMSELKRLAQDLRGLARHVRMVSMNASIEANRAGMQGAGFAAVAHEMADVAARTVGLSEQVQQRVDQLEQILGPLRKDVQLHDTGNDELTIEVQIRARAVLSELLNVMGGRLQSSRELRETSRHLSDQLEQVLMGFQSGDRVSQMLEILSRDLNRMVDWNSVHDHARPADAMQWLTELEQSYTMNEQRNEHHETVAIDREAGVEFF